MEILILTPNGETVKMPTWKTESVIDLKKRISEKLFMAPEELQRILFNGHVLDDENSVEQFAIEDKSVITLVEGLRGSGITIFATTIDGRATEIEIDPTETVLSLKRKIEEKLTIDPDSQQLVFEGEMLNDDENKLKDYPITDDSVIDVVERRRGSGISIFAKTIDGRATEIEIDPTETVLTLKKKIKEKFDIDPENQRLIFTGKQLDDDKIINDYNITDRSLINVVLRLRGGLFVYVRTLDGKTVTVEGTGRDTILDLKKQIEWKMCIPLDLQSLRYGGVILDDESKIADYTFCAHSVINLIVTASRQILVRTPDGGTFKQEMGGTRTVHDLKKRIGRNLSLTIEELSLMFQDIVLEDDTMIEKLNILEDSVISVHIIKRIYFEKDGKKIFLPVGMEETISDIKRRICEKADSSSDDIQLCYKAGRRLRDDKTLLDYKIEDTAQIRVLFLW